MDKKTISTCLRGLVIPVLALVAMAGQAQTFTPIVEDTLLWNVHGRRHIVLTRSLPYFNENHFEKFFFIFSFFSFSIIFHYIFSILDFCDN